MNKKKAPVTSPTPCRRWGSQSFRRLLLKNSLLQITHWRKNQGWASRPRIGIVCGTDSSRCRPLAPRPSGLGLSPQDSRNGGDDTDPWHVANVNGPDSLHDDYRCQEFVRTLRKSCTCDFLVIYFWFQPQKYWKINNMCSFLFIYSIDFFSFFNFANRLKKVFLAKL